jgi:hypothetical protein
VVALVRGVHCERECTRARVGGTGVENVKKGACMKARMGWDLGQWS